MPINWNTRIRTIDFETDVRRKRLAAQQKRWLVFSAGLLIGVWARIFWLAGKTVIQAIAGFIR